VKKRSVKEIILRGVELELRPRLQKARTPCNIPAYSFKEAGALDIDNAKIYELISFP